MRAPADMPRPKPTAAQYGCGFGIAVMFLYVPLSLYDAWIFTYLWSWFVVPTFHLPELAVLVAWGLMLTLSLARHRYSPADTVAGDELGPKDYVIKSITDGVVFPTICLAIGFVLQAVIS